LDAEQQIREDVGADLLAIVQDDSSSCGVAWTGGSAYYATSVSDVRCFTGYFTFLHEIGHNLRCRHDASRYTTSEIASIGYRLGYCWDDADTSKCGDCHRSVMSYSSCETANGCTSCQRRPYMSNPDVIDIGNPTGTADADNARNMNEMKGAAQAWRTSTVPGGIIFDSEPNNIFRSSCAYVNISGWSIGSGSDITEVTLSGVPVSFIVEQSRHHVLVLSAVSASSGTGDIVITRSIGATGTTTLKDGFTFDATSTTSNVGTAVCDNEPTSAPTTSPPTESPTLSPTLAPTTAVPTAPSVAPTVTPSSFPTAAPTAAPTPEVCYAQDKKLGDGKCDANNVNNVAACGWDGGDCCESSCKANPNTKASKNCGKKGYDCKDPALNTVAPTSTPTVSAAPTATLRPTPSLTSVCYAQDKKLGDGKCDANNVNNVAACGWDGGDCCESSCKANPNTKASKNCGKKGYDCKDPVYA
jgi:hypothetical protein